MLAVLIGYGPNDVKIPILVFESLDQAKKHCSKIFGLESSNNSWRLNLEAEQPYAEVGPAIEGDLLEMRNASEKEQSKEEKRRLNNVFRDECKKRMKKGPPFKIEELFKSYYGGCGECYRAELKEVQPGEAFGAWNLD